MFERLDEVVVEARLVGATILQIHGQTRQRDQDDLWLKLSNTGGDFVAILVRQTDIDYRNVGLEFARGCQCGGAAGGDTDLMAVALQQRFHCHGRIGIVLDDQNLARRNYGWSERSSPPQQRG